MKKKFLSIILTAVLATTAISSAAALTTSAAEVNTSSVSAGQYAVSTPQLSKIENADGQVNLSWKSVAGAYKYRVYYKGRNGWTRFAETTGTTAVDDVVKSGSTYTYTIRALDKNNHFVSDFNHTGWKHTYVSVPKFTSIENTDGQVNLSWKSVAGAHKYRVYYKGRNGWTRFAETTGTTAVDDVVRSGSTYTYTVRALDKNNNFVSDFNHSGWKHMYVSNPKFSKIENLDGGVKLTWKSVAGAYKYRVYYKSRNGWTRFAETTGTTAIDDVVRSGATYTYTVRALDKNNNFVSDFNHSGWQQTYISTPKITNLENTVEGIKITWDKVEGAEFYRVFYRGSDGWKRLTTTADTSVFDTNVKAGNTYTYTVRCIDRMDNYISDYVSPGWQLKRLERHDAVYEYIDHPAETEQVWVVDKESYTVEDGVYERHVICKGCVDKASEIVGYRLWDIEETEPEWYAAFQKAGINPFLDYMSEDELINHMSNHLDKYENSGSYTATVRVGTQTITVPEEGHWETKVIKEAWTEKVLVKEAGWY